MGLLRADRITGLGGANAITGSVFFGGGGSSDNHLLVNGADTEFGTSGSFTIEFWMNPIGAEVGSGNIGLTAITDPRTSDSSVHPLIWISGGFGGKANDVLYYYAGGSDRIVGTTVLQRNRWYHVAVVRTGGTTTMYLDGSSEGSFSDSLDYAANNGFYIGQRYTSTTYNFNGHISNFRLIKGTALYTGTFTPPTTRLTKTSDTEILCCNSASDVTNDETGKVIIVGRSNTNNTGPVASRFTPNSPVGFSTTTDVGSQYGTTFGDNTKFDTKSYMVPPGGNTRERNRGRGLIMGGSTPSESNVINFIQIQSTGIGMDFGDLTKTTNGSGGCCSSSTRGLHGGGSTGSPSAANSNIIDYVTIATTANAADFGDLTVARRGIAGCGNNTRGLFGGGRSDPSGSNPTDEIDYITIATLGNATDFGNLSVARRYLASTASSTRGLWAGGDTPSDSDVIDYVTIASTGNATDFGNLTQARDQPEGCASSTRALWGNGSSSPTLYNIIDYITMASTGNAVDFGDTNAKVADSQSTSNSIRGIWAGGLNPSLVNTIDYVTIATTGDAADFGDLPTVQGEGGGCSDSHGGLS